MLICYESPDVLPGILPANILAQIFQILKTLSSIGGVIALFPRVYSEVNSVCLSRPAAMQLMVL